ncbi:hypothetical protein ISCGN_025906 [Ixodes scapularis]
MTHGVHCGPAQNETGCGAGLHRHVSLEPRKCSSGPSLSSAVKPRRPRSSVESSIVRSRAVDGYVVTRAYRSPPAGREITDTRQRRFRDSDVYGITRFVGVFDTDRRSDGKDFIKRCWKLVILTPTCSSSPATIVHVHAVWKIKG